MEPPEPGAGFGWRRAGRDDRLPLARMLELYQHDLSACWPQDLDVHGEYGWPLDRYWLRPDCHPFVATCHGRWAGFALVDGAVRVGTGGCWMDQFFVLRKYRGHGLGRQLAWAVFDALPGRWEVGQMAANRPAQQFWRRVIGDYTGGRYTEHRLDTPHWQGPVQCFESTGRSARPQPRGST